MHNHRSFVCNIHLFCCREIYGLVGDAVFIRSFSNDLGSHRETALEGSGVGRTVKLVDNDLLADLAWTVRNTRCGDVKHAGRTHLRALNVNFNLLGGRGGEIDIEVAQALVGVSFIVRVGVREHNGKGRRIENLNQEGEYLAVLLLAHILILELDGAGIDTRNLKHVGKGDVVERSDNSVGHCIAVGIRERPHGGDGSLEVSFHIFDIKREDLVETHRSLAAELAAVDCDGSATAHVDSRNSRRNVVDVDFKIL